MSSLWCNGPPPLAMSESKVMLMARLGLSGPQGQEIYKLLLIEASNARDRLSHDSRNLTAYALAQTDPPAQKPYKWEEISETAKHFEILRLVRWAGSITAPYYHMGYYKRAVEENWVAQWFLWHAFRYRDNRPRPGSDPGDRIPSLYYDPIYDMIRFSWV